MSEPQQVLNYAHALPRRRAWTFVSVVVAFLGIAAVCYFTPVVAKVQARYLAWRILKAEQRCIAASLKPGDKVYSSDLNLLLPGEQSTFDDQTSANEAGLTHYLRPWTRRSDEWEEFHRLHSSQPQSYRRVGNTIVPSNFLPVPEKACVLSVVRITDTNGVPWDRLTVLEDARTDWLELAISYMSPPGLPRPTTQPPPRLYRLAFRWNASDGAAMVRVAQPSNADSRISLDFSQGGATHRLEVFETASGYQAAVDGKSALSSVTNGAQFGPIGLPRPSRHVSTLFGDSMAVVACGSWPQLFFCPIRQLLLVFDPEQLRITEVETGRPRGFTLAMPYKPILNMLPSQNVAPQSAFYDPGRDQLGWLSRSGKLWVGSSAMLGAAKPVNHAIPTYDPHIAFDRAGGQFVVVGYRAPLQSIDYAGAVRWSNSLELHNCLAAGKSIVISQRSNGDPQTLLVCDAKTGRSIRELRIRTETRMIALSADETRAAVVNSGVIGEVVDLATGEPLAATPGNRSIDYATFSPDGRWVAFSGQQLMLVDLADPKQPRYFTYANPAEPEYARHVNDAAFDANSKKLYLLVKLGNADVVAIDLP